MDKVQNCTLLEYTSFYMADLVQKCPIFILIGFSVAEKGGCAMRDKEGEAETSEIFRLLALHGIPCLSEETVEHDPEHEISERSEGRRIVACVIGLEVPLLLESAPTVLLAKAVRHQAKPSWKRYTAEEQTSREHRKAASLALRCTYALGLRAAIVKLVYDGQGRLLVSDVQARTMLAMRRTLEKHRVEVGDAMPGDSSIEGPMLLGADIELILMDAAGQVVPAERYLPRQGTVGCDTARWEGKLAYPLMELRPKPADDPKGLLRSLHQAIQLAALRIPDRELAWRSGGLPHDALPLGGHLHFSGVGLNEQLLRALDNYVALPILMLEDEPSMRRRPKFGFLGDFRRKSHGGFEYRTLPSWMISPQYALCVMLLAHMVVLNHGRLKQRPLHDVAVQEQYYAGDKAKLRRTVQLLWKELELLPQYRANRKRMDALKRHVLQGTAWTSDKDIREAWKIQAPTNKGRNPSQIVI